MERYEEIINKFSSDGFFSLQQSLQCPECAERSYLKMLVAELLYKNQVLRFDLLEAQTQLARAKGAL